MEFLRRRREFIILIGGAAVTSPFAAHAQQTVARIGVLLVGGPEFMGPYRDALRDLGYVEGKNIQLEVRSAGGQANRLHELAAELVRNKVDVIVASLPGRHGGEECHAQYSHRHGAGR